MLFTMGVLVGLLAMWMLYTNKRRQIKLLDEEKQLLQQEKQIVVEFMHNMVEAVVKSPDRETMFQRIIHAAILSTGAVSACIFEKRPDNTLQGIAIEGLFPPQRKLPAELEGKITTRAHYLEKILKSETFNMGEGLIGQVAKSQRALLIPDATIDPRVITHGDPSLKIRSIIVAPVLFNDELIAVLAVTNPIDALSFTDTDFSLVESLAEQVGLAVHNSDAMQMQIEKSKIDLDIELASNTQRLLLPRQFPPSQSISFATHYTAAQKVGGDLYDVFALDEDTVAFAIADVSGKGVSASILMAICQTHLRHFSKAHRSPSKVLSEINHAMGSHMQRDMFITMLYAVIDLNTDQLTIARAGHEPPFFYHSDNGNVSVQPVESPGMAVGMVPREYFDPIIKDKTIAFGPGDALLLYTDGVTESVNLAGDEFSGDSLKDVLHKHGYESAQAIVDHTLDNVNRFANGADQVDDLTLIAIKHA